LAQEDLASAISLTAKSRFHSLTRQKTKQRRKLVLTPDNSSGPATAHVCSVLLGDLLAVARGLEKGHDTLVEKQIAKQGQSRG
jgi:hypothetical protein